MRELVFSIEFDRGADPVMDVFLEHPELRARSLACHASLKGVCRLDRITGPPAAVEELEGVFLDDGRCNDCLRASGCDADLAYDVLTETAGDRLVYAYCTGTNRCSAIPELARELLGDGLLFRTVRAGERYEWRILVGSDGDVGRFLDSVREALGAGRRFELEYLGQVTEWTDGPIAGPSLPHEQQIALQQAVEGGYYETPRKTTLDELSERLEVPRSTLSYRLRRAEATLVRAFVSREPPACPESPSPR